jgi:hypothetical protein
LVSEVKLTDTNIEALAATPITLVPAPPANKAIIFERASLVYDVTTTGYTITNAGDDLAIRYGTGPVDIAHIEAVGFLDQATDQVRLVQPGINSPFGAVTQATNKATGVTINSRAGIITMNNAQLLLATTVLLRRGILRLRSLPRAARWGRTR